MIALFAKVAALVAKKAKEKHTLVILLVSVEKLCPAEMAERMLR